MRLLGGLGLGDLGAGIRLGFGGLFGPFGLLGRLGRGCRLGAFLLGGRFSLGHALRLWEELRARLRIAGGGTRDMFVLDGLRLGCHSERRYCSLSWSRKRKWL